MTDRMSLSLWALQSVASINDCHSSSLSASCTHSAKMRYVQTPYEYRGLTRSFSLRNQSQPMLVKYPVASSSSSDRVDSRGPSRRLTVTTIGSPVPFRSDAEWKAVCNVVEPRLTWTTAWSTPACGRLPLFSTRSAVTFPAIDTSLQAMLPFTTSTLRCAREMTLSFQSH